MGELKNKQTNKNLPQCGHLSAIQKVVKKQLKIKTSIAENEHYLSEDF